LLPGCADGKQTFMILSFFKLAAVSRGRQHSFRSLAVAHLLVLGTAAFALPESPVLPRAVLLGNVLLVCGIVEGALLIGWRLTQLPKSQALEFLLVSPLRPPFVLLVEALVGVALLGLVTLAALPVLLLLVLDGAILAGDVVTLLVLPFTWGAVTGLGLTAWAFEPVGVRRWGERLVIGLVLLYLVVGVLAGENLRQWLSWLPADIGRTFMDVFFGLHRHNPFAVMKDAMAQDPAVVAPRLLAMEMAGLVIAALLAARAALRLHGHFRDRHYRPVLSVDETHRRGLMADRPLAWWAVRRVTEYSGRINLWLAGGFGLLYAMYTLAGPSWPPWLGRAVFVVFDRLGGIPVLATALVLLAAVPAAFQYGLWDSNAQDRCRRLELLLLTRLEASDYWDAAAAAAWRRGRGYFAVAVLLWLAAGLTGQVSFSQVAAALGAGAILWGLYFALGFRAFARGIQANRLGLVLTIGLPLTAYLLFQSGWPELAVLVPPGGVYYASALPLASAWLMGPLLGSLLALHIARTSLVHCDRDLRRWYADHHGRSPAD
jgi:hypothetical protein